MCEDLTSECDPDVLAQLYVVCSSGGSVGLLMAAKPQSVDAVVIAHPGRVQVSAAAAVPLRMQGGGQSQPSIAHLCACR